MFFSKQANDMWQVASGKWQVEQLATCNLPPATCNLSLLTFYFPLLTLLFLSACGLANPPRLATATAQAAFTPTPSPEPLVLTVATPTAVPGTTPGTAPAQAEPNPSITVWVNETSADHRTMLDQMAADFEAQHSVDVEMVLVSPQLLPDLVNTAVLSGTLPDIIIHPLEFSVGWAERGVFDTAANTEALAQLGEESFNPNALSLVQTSSGQPAALPNSGYHQLVIYRTDWFDERNLAIPNTFRALSTAAEATTDRDNLIAGFVVPTEANLVTTQQIFEHMALATGCQLVDEAGEIQLLDPACAEALTFYYTIINQNSPIGVQTDTSTRNAYLAGRTGLIMGPPSLLPQIAGLDPAAPPRCPECAATPDFLAQNSGFVTDINGAEFGSMSLLGITSAAERETAVLFATYWFSEGYEQWLAVDPERKVPMRWGTPGSPRQFIDSWGSQPLAGSNETLESLYGPDVVAALREGIATTGRWGLPQGQGELITTLYEELTLSIVLQEMLSGYFSSDQSIIEAYNRIVDLIPNYAFPNLTDNLPDD
ncbi:MAG: extracellular solute-binding protein [Anaerolineaceae bacterium]|nr:extracellular solute-binding protein [Anaerolineaceae bacterium]